MPRATHPSLTDRARWQVHDGDWFVKVIPAHRAELVDARRIIVALRQGAYEDHTQDPNSSRKVLDSLSSGLIVTFATYNDTDHSLAWWVGGHGALVEVSLSGDVLRLQSALFFVD
jgi:hypothetical protein